MCHHKNKTNMTKDMNFLLKLEELGQLLLSILLFQHLDYAWWIYPACILLPDVSMLGYLFNTKIGAWAYNLFHHKLLGIAVIGLGYWLNHDLMTLSGIILFGHSAMDRALGYGLKYADSFQHTHLGWVGKK